MSVCPILQLGDYRLREKCAVVDDPTGSSTRDVIQDLRDTLRHARATTGYGRGIAAPQIGKLLRLIYLNIPGVSPFAMINPEIISRSEEEIIVWDACLSFLSIFMQVKRSAGIRVRYTDSSGAE